MRMTKLLLHDKPYFACRTSKTCEHWIRRNYTMLKPSDNELINCLQEFGKLSVLDFSEFHSLAKKCFFIKSDNEIRISGTESDENIELTMKNENAELVHRFEKIVTQWLQRQFTSQGSE